MSTLIVNSHISEWQSKDMLYMFIEHGDHSYRDKISKLNRAQIKLWLKQNKYPLDKLVADCKTFATPVPLFENLLGSTMQMVGSGKNCTVSIVDAYSNKPIATLENSDGIIDMCPYDSQFRQACKLRDNAIKETDFRAFCSALSNGVASIEAYIKHRVEFWNTHSNSEQLMDSKTNKVPFETKVKEWLPIMSKGRRLDLSTIVWKTFKELVVIRDDDAIHQKYSARCIPFKELAININKFKLGIAKFLVELHLLFNEPIKSAIIRANFYPEVRAIKS